MSFEWNLSSRFYWTYHNSRTVRRDESLWGNRGRWAGPPNFQPHWSRPGWTPETGGTGRKQRHQLPAPPSITTNSIYLVRALLHYVNKTIAMLVSKKQEHCLLRLTKYWLSGDATCTIQSEAFSGSPMFMRAEPRRNWREWQFQSHHVDSRRTYSWICMNWQAESKMQHLWPPLFFVYIFFTTTCIASSVHPGVTY